MAYKYIAEEWAQPEKSFVEELMRERLVQWRKQPSTLALSIQQGLTVQEN